MNSPQSKGLKSPVYRLFFALWPDTAAGAATKSVVDTLRRSVVARWVPPEQWHLTLVFLGAVEADRLSAALACGDAVEAPSGVIHLERIEHWRRSGVICLTGAPDTVSPLLRSLTTALRAADFQLETRPFRAHLTLARKAFRAAPESPLAAPVVWPFKSFSLVESVPTRSGSEYRSIKTWPLSASMREPAP